MNGNLMKVGMGDLGASLYTYIRSGLHLYTCRVMRIFAQAHAYGRSACCDWSCGGEGTVG